MQGRPRQRKGSPIPHSTFGGSLLTQEGTKNKSQAQLGCDWEFEDARTPAAAKGISNPSLSFFFYLFTTFLTTLTPRLKLIFTR